MILLFLIEMPKMKAFCSIQSQNFDLFQKEIKQISFVGCSCNLQRILCVHILFLQSLYAQKFFTIKKKYFQVSVLFQFDLNTSTKMHRWMRNFNNSTLNVYKYTKFS